MVSDAETDLETGVKCAMEVTIDQIGNTPSSFATSNPFGGGY